MRVRVSTKLHRDDRAGWTVLQRPLIGIVLFQLASMFAMFFGFQGSAARVVAAGSVGAFAYLMSRTRISVPTLEWAHQDETGVTVGKGVLWLRNNYQRRWYSLAVLRRSVHLRIGLRREYGVTLELGDDSPEVLRPGDPPIAEWQTVSALPEAVDGARTSSVYRTSAAGPSVLREPFDERAGRSLRETANSFTTVVDEAALDDERLYVREGKDVASMDLSLLRGAAPLSDGSVAFSFGKFTTVVFSDASASKIVGALRDRIPRRSEAPEPAAAAFEEVAEVQEVEEEAGSGARAKSTAR